jgi:hypothetical protein
MKEENVRMARVAIIYKWVIVEQWKIRVPRLDIHRHGIKIVERSALLDW